jgi:beta-galactosidase
MKRLLMLMAILCCAGIPCPGIPHSQTRTAALRQEIPLSGPGWQFVGASETEDLPDLGSPGYSGAAWSNVALPHIFQTRQAYDALTQAWYRREIAIPAALKGKRLFVVFEGVTSVADVYVNGRHLGQHRGAYTRFLFDATTALHPGPGNQIAVRVDNTVSRSQDLFPNKTRLYKLWGGINRKVWLLATEPLHIDPTDYASSGIYITPSNVSADSAKLSTQVLVRNDLPSIQDAQVRATLIAPSGAAVKTFTGTAKVNPGERATVALEGTVEHPRLWEPGQPNLYHLRVEVLSGGRIVDTVIQPTGFRTVDFRFSENKVFVNGKRWRFFGADLHPEVEDKGNAVSDDDLRANFDLMQDLGVNFMRLPHYPHAQFEYDLCDERGIFCWAENGHTNDEKFGPTGEQITTEIVKQNYNHPAIPLWSVGNEAFAETSEAAVPVVRALDPIRPVLVANMKCANCDFHTANVYPGWYGKGDFRGYTPEGFISETGAGGVVTTHTDYNQANWTVNKYEPEEYQQLVAENHMSKAADPSNEKLAMFLWWTMRDFSDRKYKGPVGINSKGLLTYAGDKKDVYYLYRSFLRPSQPTVRITSQRYFLRQGAVDNGIKVYGNAKQLTLSLNGQVVSTLENGKYIQPTGPYFRPTTKNANMGPQKIDNVFYWPVRLHTGKNTVSVTDGLGHSDSATFYFYGANGLPESLSPSPLIKDLTSSNARNAAYFMDMPPHEQWPIYYDLDGTADNSWNRLPPVLQGARWIALRRVTKPDAATAVQFTLRRQATVYVATTEGQADNKFVESLQSAKFAAVSKGEFTWRNNDLILVPARLYARRAAAGERISILLGETDAVVLVKK